MTVLGENHIQETEVTTGLFNNVHLHVEDSGGNGRPVILVHGWPLSGKSFEHQVSALTSAGYRVITYDRRGFGESEPGKSYTYGTLTKDLGKVIEDLDLHDITIVGFSMGGGEVAHYASDKHDGRVRSVVFAASVTPFMIQSDDNPDGPLSKDKAEGMNKDLLADREAFFDSFTKDFFSANGELKVSESERLKAVALCLKSDQGAAVACMNSFGTTDFREDLARVTVPALVLHGDADAVVPFEGSGKRTHEILGNSTLHVVAGAPHGFNVSHSEEFNKALLEFLAK